MVIFLIKSLLLTNFLCIFTVKSSSNFGSGRKPG
jgi:hypothetical protein